MSPDDRVWLLRLAGIYLPLAAVICLAVWRRPDRRWFAALLLAFAWNLPALMALHLAAGALGWWTFGVGEAAVLGLPVDAWLGWALLWGPLPLLLFPRGPRWLPLLAAALADAALMPQLAPLLVLGDGWWWGEAAGVAGCLLPAYLLGQWTLERRCVRGRVALQAVGASALMLGLLPLLVLLATGADPAALLLGRPTAWYALVLQALVLPAVVGYSAALEFARRGDGTALPFDPPQRLVTSGPYAYLRSPMQAVGCLGYLVLAVALDCPWLLVAAVSIIAYGAGIAGYDEERDMAARYGEDWHAYRIARRRWLPAWRPYADPRHTPVLYVAAGCDPCSAFGRWLLARRPVNLRLEAAERHPSGPPTRLTYDPGDGTPEVHGVAGLARAFEHLHLGWAMVGWVLAFPGVLTVVQAFADASGGGPRVLACELSPEGSGTLKVSAKR